MNFLITIFLITNILAFKNLLIYHVHMFQLNSYSIIEEKRFLNENKYPVFGRVFGIFIELCLFTFSLIFSLISKCTNYNIFKFPSKIFYFFLIISIILNIFTSIGNKEKKKAKIKLNYTKRVKRLFVTCSLIYFSSIVITYLIFVKKLLISNYKFFYNGTNILIFLILINILTMYPHWIILLGNLINKPIEKNINLFYVNDAKEKINSMTNLKVIGITGSFGKTSMKNILGTLLSKDFNTLITPKNYNTTLGVTLTIREHLSPIHEIFICEMGAKGTGEIKEICDLVNPRLGIITSIGPMHLESFGSIENIINTKFELYDYLKKGDRDDPVFLNFDNDLIVKKLEEIKNKNGYQKKSENTITYGIKNKSSDFIPYDISVSNEGSTFYMDLDGEKVKFETNLLGIQNVLNISGAISVAKKLKVTNKTLVERVKEIKQIPHRQEIIKKSFGIIIDDAYNSNPTGCKMALETLKMFKDYSKIIITPGMVELGAMEDKLNFEFGENIGLSCDYAILVGKEKTSSIKDGIFNSIKNTNAMKKENVFVVSTIEEALQTAFKIKDLNEDNSLRKKAILLENDLPDNY